MPNFWKKAVASDRKPKMVPENPISDYFSKENHEKRMQQHQKIMQECKNWEQSMDELQRKLEAILIRPGSPEELNEILEGIANLDNEELKRSQKLDADLAEYWRESAILSARVDKILAKHEAQKEIFAKEFVLLDEAKEKLARIQKLAVQETLLQYQVKQPGQDEIAVQKEASSIRAEISKHIQRFAEIFIQLCELARELARQVEEICSSHQAKQPAARDQSSAGTTEFQAFPSRAPGFDL
jgi:hypothetical protein